MPQLPPQHFDQLKLLERAARCAIGCWFNKEQELCIAVQRAQGPDHIFPDGWFDYWQVARTYRAAGDRERICQLLFEAIPHLASASPNKLGWRLVEELSAQIKPMNCGWRPTSLVSKFAFSCGLTVFVPYDRIVRGQLRTPDHNYLAYGAAFAQRQANIEQQLRSFVRPDKQVGLAAQNLRFDGNVMNQELFVAHVTDWYLLLQGKYDPMKTSKRKPNPDPVYLGPIT